MNVLSTLSLINDFTESYSVFNAECSVSNAFKSLSNNFSLLLIFAVFELYSASAFAKSVVSDYIAKLFVPSTDTRTGLLFSSTFVNDSK